VFKELIDALRQRPLLKQMLSEMEEMLTAAVDMYRPIAKVLTGRAELTKAARDAIYETDRRINHLQRKVRKQLVEHLAMAPGSDVPISLILMSITKDAERLGDYCKNLLEVAEAMERPLGLGSRGTELVRLLDEVERLFGPVAAATMKSDKAGAAEAVARGRKIASECDALIDDLIGSDVPTREAVLLALSARYLKRIALHLTNVASSVVQPLHRLDYADEEGSDHKRSARGETT
jgi:phosphate transport system protein